MKIFRGWKIVAVAFVCYGFGISPAYYSWGFYFPELSVELGYTKADLGLVFGLFTFLYSAVGPIVGFLQNRIGIRTVMTLGSFLAAIGFIIVSRADTKAEFLIGFSVFGGCGIGLSTIIPTQTLGQNWFLKRRALAIAIIMCAGGIVGKIVPMVDAWVIENFDGTWRTGWVIIACVSVVVGLLAAAFVRDTPEQLGLNRDGAATPAPSKETTQVPIEEEVSWTARQAVATRQFFLITIAGVAYATPWGVVVAHGRTHLSELGFELKDIAALMGSLALVSILGRVTGILGDRLNPRYVIIVGLALEGIGAAGFYFVDSKAFASLCLLLLGIGFGATYICIPVIFSEYFGRKAFGTTAGTRMLITGVFNGLGPFVTGLIADKTGSYFIPFMALAVLCFIGSFAAAVCTDPGPPPGSKSEPEP
ncbi:MAG: MFS transporter, partial [Candidatus Hydrogenedentota bacterium]